MEVKDVPIQAVIAIVGSLLAIIGGLILWYLTKLLGEVKELKEDIKSLEDKKVSKNTLEITLKSMNDKLGQIVQSQQDIRNDLSGFGKRVDTRLQDHDRQFVELRQ